MPQGRTEGDFNPRSPHGERPWEPPGVRPGDLFQSTLPARGATRRARPAERRNKSISIHAPRTGSDATKSSSGRRPAISIHAPRTGSDQIKPGTVRQNGDFNPRSPHGERHLQPSPCPHPRHFNPRSPHGERPHAGDERGGGMAFQSTLPARGATHHNWEG